MTPLKLWIGDFNKVANRISFVRSLSATIMGEWSSRNDLFQPYTINDSDMNWVLDRGNDWRLHFTGDDTVRLSYRYARPGDVTDPEIALVHWMQFRYGAEVYDEVSL